MGKHSYVIYEVNIALFRRPAIAVPLNDVDGNGADFFRLVQDQLEKVRDVVVENDRTERAHRVETVGTRNRSILVEGKVGPYGSFGTSVDLDTGDERDYSDRTANMTPLRSLLVIPREGLDALMICERVGSSHFRNAIEKSVFNPIGTDLGIKVKTLAHVDPEAWARFLEGGDVQKITAVYRSRRVEDLGAQRGRAQDLKIVAGGVVARRLGRRLTNLISNLARAEQPVSYNIDEYPDLRPGDQENYEQDHLEVQVGDDGDQRTVIIEQTQLPQFTYPLGGKVRSELLWDVWEEHAHRILSARGASM